MSTRKNAPVKFELPAITNASKARARLMLDRLCPKAEWLNYINQRSDVPAHMKTAAFYDRFEKELREMLA